MNMETTNNKHYFAFISYKRQDEEWAKWFQKEMEDYHLPATLNGRDDLPKTFRPVFRDIDELKAGNLPTQIYDALASSSNLVVICSTQLADDENAKWVNQEISDFIKIGKNEGRDNVKHIFPFIVDGVPHAGDERECFPRALRELSEEQERIGGNINEGGDVGLVNRERAFVKVLAGMLPDGVSFDMLWNRYDRDKMERERKEKEERDKLLIAQSRFVAEKAVGIVDEDSYLARRLAVEVLPMDLEDPNRPYCAEAEMALRESCEHNSAVFMGHSRPAKAFFSPNGKLVVSASFDYTVRIWDVETGRELKRKTFDDVVYYAAFTPDGNRVVCAVWDFTIRIWNFANETDVIIIKSDCVALSVAISPDSRQIVSTHQCGLVYLYNNFGNPTLKRLDGHTNDVISASFSPDGESFVTASFDGTIRIWNAATGKEWKWKMLKPNAPISFHSISYSPDGKLIVSCGNENGGHNLIRNAIVHIWDANTGERLKEYIVLRNNANILSTSFSPDGKSLLLAAEDNRIRILDFENGNELKQLKVTSIGSYANPNLAATYSPEGKKVVCTPADGTIRVWEIEQDFDYIKLNSEYNIHSIAFSPDGRNLVVAYDKNNLGIKTTLPENNSISLGLGDYIGIWSIDEYGVILREWVGHEGYVNSLSYSLDGQFIVSSSFDNTIRIWEAETGLQLRKLHHISNDNSSASFCMNGIRIVSVEGDNTIKVWSLLDDNDFYIKERTRAPYAISPEGKRIASIYIEEENNAILVWDVETGEDLIKLYGQDKRIVSLAFSIGEEGVVALSQDGTIHHWIIDTGEELKKHHCSLLMNNSTLSDERVAFDSMGKSFVAYQEDHIRVWNSDVGVEVMKGPKDAISRVTFSPNGKRIGSVLSDGTTIRIISFPPLQDLIDQTRERFKDRPLTPEERRQYYLE